MKERLVPHISFDRMTPTDIKTVCEIENLSFSVPWSREMFVAEIREDPFSYFLVARENEARQVVGYVCFLVVFDELHLMNLAVHPLWRRLGIGEELVKNALEVGREKEVKMVTLEVRASNEAARGLYEKLGFRMVAIRRGYYTHPKEDALILRLDTL